MIAGLQFHRAVPDPLGGRPGADWTHRAYYKVRLLWRFHAVHHSAENTVWMAGSRLHLLVRWTANSALMIRIVSGTT